MLEAVAAIAELGLAIDLIAVIPSTENMPSGTAVKPGDIITQYNGKTVEVNNTDAEGRLILADALTYCVELGAEPHRRHRDPDRRRPRRARLHLLGADLQRRRARLGGGARRRGDRRARLAAAASSRVQGADQGHGGRPHQRSRRSARRGRSTPAPSWRSSSTAGPGRTSTSPVPPGTSAAPTSATARPASACVSSSPWPGRWRGAESPGGRDPQALVWSQGNERRS